jgi:O-methyltransferase
MEIVLKQIDTDSVEILQNSEFLQSLAECQELSMLDHARLANLWDLCRSSNPKGAILEIGSYRGGTALHLSNSCPDRKIIIAESYKGFKEIVPEIDTRQRKDGFKWLAGSTEKEDILEKFRKKNRDLTIFEGFFPDSCLDKTLPDISFVHLDVDCYLATKQSLEYIAQKLLEQSLIVIDDFKRKHIGVDRAVQEFLEKNNEWIVFPLYPAQGLLFKKG